MQTDTMREPPTRSDVANFEKQARRVLTKSRDRDVRQLAKDFIDWSMQIDRYVESMYPCFSIMEEKVRDFRAEQKKTSTFGIVECVLPFRLRF